MLVLNQIKSSLQSETFIRGLLNFAIARVTTVSWFLMSYSYGRNDIG